LLSWPRNLAQFGFSLSSAEYFYLPADTRQLIQTSQASHTTLNNCC